MQEHEILKYTSRLAREVGEALRDSLSRPAHRVHRLNQRRRWGVRLVKRDFDLRRDNPQQLDYIVPLLLRGIGLQG
jgi:hypothetical protein